MDFAKDFGSHVVNVPLTVNDLYKIKIACMTMAQSGSLKNKHKNDLFDICEFITSKIDEDEKIFFENKKEVK